MLLLLLLRAMWLLRMLRMYRMAGRVGVCVGDCGGGGRRLAA